jgi:predicted nucleotidyltransferase
MKTKRLNKDVTYKLHMKHKYYIFEIVRELLKEENHLRGIALKVGTNPMMVSRKLEELSSLNVVDYRMQGKNKVYFVKKTTEARNFVLMAELNSLLEFIANHPSFKRVINKIQSSKEINLAIIFGSYAKGNQTSKSDLDIYIPFLDKKLKQDLENFDSKLSIKTGEYDKNNFLIKEIEKSHIIIKGVEEFYEKNKFFEYVA